MAKRYYWLKLKENFFRQKEIKKLRRIAGGDTHTIIYLKLQLLSLKNEGILYFEGVEESFIEEMALELDEDVENVKLTMLYLERHGLIQGGNADEYILPETIASIGSEGDSAERVRRHREQKEKQKALQCNGNLLQSNSHVTNGNTEIELEKELKKEKEKEKKKEKKEYAKNVKMKPEQYQKLITRFGEAGTEDKIERLSLYKTSKGKKYSCDYSTILNWDRMDRERNGPKGELNDSYSSDGRRPI